MVATLSTMLPLGTEAPDFTLPDFNGKTYSLDDFSDAKALLVMFLSNHCPFVKPVRREVARVAKKYQAKGVAVVAINANDIETYPEDSPENMAKEAKMIGYTFPYLFDESQEVAKAYHAACTPDFYVFDGDRRLAYRGQFDDSRPGKDIPVTGKDLRAALEAVLQQRPVAEEQKPSIGCNIKWKFGNEPDYFG